MDSLAQMVAQEYNQGQYIFSFKGEDVRLIPVESKTISFYPLIIWVIVRFQRQSDIVFKGIDSYQLVKSYIN